MNDSKNSELLQSFRKFCVENPELRFWQALRHWCGADFIYWAKLDRKTGEDRQYDTFYWENTKKPK